MSGFGWNQQSGPIAPVLIYPVVGVLLMGLCMTFVVEPIMGGIDNDESYKQLMKTIDQILAADKN